MLGMVQIGHPSTAGDMTFTVNVVPMSYQSGKGLTAINESKPSDRVNVRCSGKHV